jgi:serine O-acetyltransferase
MVVNKFKLFQYLVADFHRLHFLLNGEIKTSFTLMTWLGVFSPRFIPVILCRLAYFFYCHGFSLFAKLMSLFNFFFFGIEIGIRCEIGKGLFFPHTHGTVIGAWKIGENATIYQGVTIGARELDFSYLKTSRPSIGNDVVIATGAAILGAVHIGNRSRIGANSVVLSSIPDDVLAVGAPARVVKTLN